MSGGNGASYPFRTFKLERQQNLATGLEDAFAFFSDPGNLEAITPPWLHFRVVACSTQGIQEGTLLDYRLRLHGIPIRWRTLIRSWDPPHGFVDEQLVGPYRLWVHHHTFTPLEDGGVHTTDEVTYAVPGGRLVNRLFVRPDLRRIFDYRQEQLAALLGAKAG